MYMETGSDQVNNRDPGMIFADPGGRNAMISARLVVILPMVNVE